VAIAHGSIGTASPEPAGKKLDTAKVTTSEGEVHREVMALGSPTDPEAQVEVKNAAPGSSEYGAVVRIPEPAVAVLSSAAQSASSGVVFAANAARRGFVIVNEQPASEQGESLYLAFAATATITAYTKRLGPGETWERQGGYTGVISGIWSAAGTGAARVTEES
jgi:hypothetical protein